MLAWKLLANHFLLVAKFQHVDLVGGFQSSMDEIQGVFRMKCQCFVLLSVSLTTGKQEVLQLGFFCSRHQFKWQEFGIGGDWTNSRPQRFPVLFGACRRSETRQQSGVLDILLMSMLRLEFNSCKIECFPDTGIDKTAVGQRHVADNNDL